MTDSTSFLPLGWLSRLLAWGVTLLILSFISRHAGGLALSLWSLFCWSLIHLLNVCPCVLIREAVRALTWFLALWLLSWFLPGNMGGRLRGLLLGALHWAWRAASRLSGTLGRWLYRKVEGDPANPEKSQKNKKTH